MHNTHKGELKHGSFCIVFFCFVLFEYLMQDFDPKGGSVYCMDIRVVVNGSGGRALFLGLEIMILKANVLHLFKSYFILSNS